MQGNIFNPHGLLNLTLFSQLIIVQALLEAYSMHCYSTSYLDVYPYPYAWNCTYSYVMQSKYITPIVIIHVCIKVLGNTKLAHNFYVHRYKDEVRWRTWLHTDDMISHTAIQSNQKVSRPIGVMRKERDSKILIGVTGW